MSQYPYQPLQYQTPGASFGPPPPARPTSVTVIAILGIIFGGLAAICVPVGLIPYLMPIGVPSPLIDAVRADSILWNTTVISGLLATVLAVVLLAGSIGALSLRPAARTALLGYAFGAIFLNVISLIMNVTLLLPKVAALASQARTPDMTMNIMPLTTYGSFVIGLIFPVCIVFYMTRPHVKAAFLRSPAGPAPYLPPQPPGPYLG